MPRTRRHQATGDARLGLLFAVTTVLCWSTLPVALTIALLQIDPWTLTWFRFAVALALGGGVILAAGRWRELASLDRPGRWLLALAAVLLTINYMTYLLGLDRTTPANAQVIIQLAPILMAIGGMVVFGERYAPRQWLAFTVMLAGLGLFFNDQLRALWSERARYLAGIGFILAAAVVWAGYALAQKQLLRDAGGQTVMAAIYLFATIALLPTARPGALVELDAPGWAALWFCALNTLVAYGSFTAALRHWEASRVSAVLALTPLGTAGVATLAARAWPDWIEPEVIGPLGWLGALLVVGGSMGTSLARRRTPPINHEEER